MQVSDLSFAYGNNKILDSVNVSFEKGKITALLGANGCGKTTLFNLMTKNLRPERGNIFLDGENIQSITLKKFASKVAILHQTNTAPPDLTVEKLVSYGRLAYKSAFSIKDSKQDEAAIEWALTKTKICDLRTKSVSMLSGGQRQKVWLALALAQKTKVLMLDEPTTFLDIKHQIELLELIKELNETTGITIIMILHDVNQALYYSDIILGLKNGKIKYRLSPKEFMRQNAVNDLFDINLKTVSTETGNFMLTLRK